MKAVDGSEPHDNGVSSTNNVLRTEPDLSDDPTPLSGAAALPPIASTESVLEEDSSGCAGTTGLQSAGSTNLEASVSCRFGTSKGLLREILIGLLLVGAGFATAFWLENRIASRQEIQDNLRFIREVSVNPDVRAMPFSQMNLAGTDLSGLDLSCRGPRTEKEPICADLSRANLTGGMLLNTNLSGANLSGASLDDALVGSSDLSQGILARTSMIHTDLSLTDLSDAFLWDADLRRTTLTRANLSGAYLGGADLRNAYLAGADLSGANLEYANLEGAQMNGLISTTAYRNKGVPTLDVVSEGGVCFDDNTTWPTSYQPPAPDCSGTEARRNQQELFKTLKEEAGLRGTARTS